VKVEGHASVCLKVESSYCVVQPVYSRLVTDKALSARGHSARSPPRRGSPAPTPLELFDSADRGAPLTPTPPGYHVARRYCVTVRERAPAVECDVKGTDCK